VRQDIANEKGFLSLTELPRRYYVLVFPVSWSTLSSTYLSAPSS